MMTSRRRAPIKKAILTAMLALMLGLGIGLPSGQVQAQETVQISIVGVPGVLPSPFISDLEDDVVSGRYQLQVSYIPSGANLNPVDVIFRVELYRNRELLVDEQSLPVRFEPGTHILSPVFDRIRIERSLEEVISGVRSSLQRQLIQTGALPEGDYRLELGAEVLGDGRFNVIPGQAFFTVSYPQPPQLMTPGNRTDLTMSTPVFSWSPVLTRTAADLEYEFLLVEVFDGQNPEDAIDANRPHHDQTLLNVTSFVYTPDLFPLESGRRYAWQVRAFEAGDGLPIRNEGQSEIFTFTYDGSEVKPEDLANLERIPLVPEMAWIANPQELDAEDIGPFFELNGTAEVEFYMEEILPEPIRLRADVNGLTIQKTGMENPVVAGGRVSMDTSPLNEHLARQGQFLMLDRMQYRFGEGIQASASLRTELFGELAAEGELSVTPSGFWGTVTASLRDAPVFSEGPVSLRIDEVTATFPDRELNARASVAMEGVTSPCTIEQLDIRHSVLETSFSCSNLEALQLVEGHSLIELRPAFLFGEVIIDPEEDLFEFDIRKDARLTVSRPDEEELCHVHFQATYRSGEQVSVRPIRQSCNVQDGGLDLGFAELMFRNIQLDHLELNPSDGQWDFGVSFDSRLKVELFGGWESPWMENTMISSNGISFEQHEFARNSQTLTDFDVSDLAIHLQRLTVEEFTFPVFDWDGTGPGPWEVRFSGDVQLPPEAGIPGCLSGIGLQFDDGTIADDRVHMPFELDLAEPCRWEFGAGYAISVNGLSGVAGAEWEPMGDDQQIRPFADLDVQGGFSTGIPFHCEDERSTNQQQVEVNFSGGLQAELQNIHPDCPMQIGPFFGQVNESFLSLSWTETDGQQGELGGDITLQFSDNVQARGSFLIDIIQGRFVDGDITIDGPFDWSIPSDEEGVLTFRISQASITGEGLFIDGRQSLRLGDDPIGVTFDELLLDLHDLTIRSGQIIFDEAFAFEAGIGTDRSLQFAALPPDSNTTLDPGLYMELGSTVIIDSTGIGTTGQGQAALYYGDKAFDSDVTVDYTDDFRMSLYPFGVRSGRADIYWNDSKVAYIDRDGLNPVFTFFAELLIPDILPLPTESVAYLRLRDDEGDLLVEGTETPDGDYALSTLPGASLTLVVPAWDPADPPEVAGAQLHNVVLSGDPSMPVLKGGGVTVDIGTDDALHDLTERHIPLRLTRIHYGETVPDEQMMTMSALYLEGNLHLFDNEFDETGSAGFLLGDGGLVLANLDLSEMNQPVPMVPGSDRVVYTLNSLQGSFEGSLDGSVPPSFGFDIGGFFEINDDQETVASTALDVHLTQSTFEVTAYDGETADLPHLDLGFFGLEISEIVSFPHLSWSGEEGFSFEVAVDLSLHFNLSDGTAFSFPFAGVEIRDSGIVIPRQDVSISSRPGLSLPPFELLGLQFKPLALRTTAALEADWYRNDWNLDLDPRIDFELRLPAFEDTDLHPVDGLTFSDVGFEEGHLVGTVQTHIPLGSALVPLGPPSVSPPEIQVDSLGGSLSREMTDQGPQQNVSLYAYSRLENVPSFSQPDDDGDPCPQNPDVTLEIIDGSGFAGSVQGYTSCGEVDFGPVALGIENASLDFAFADGRQSLEASGTMEATLPAPGGTEISVTGSGNIDLFTGAITDGSISITDEFLLAYGPAGQPVFDFTVQQALLDSDGLQLSGQGSVGNDDISVGVNFNNLQFGFPEFGITGGSAVISPDLAFQVGTDLASITVSASDAPLEGENVFRYTMQEDIVISSDGITFSGSGTASLIYQGENFIDLNVQFHDDFSVEVRQYRVGVTQGRAEFYLTDPTDEYYEEGEPFVIWNASGLSIAGGALALLPDRIGLPNEEIAYIILKDADGQPLIDYNAMQDGGYELTTGDGHLPVVIPALTMAAGQAPSFMVGFTLQTDSEFNLTGGSISLADGELGDLSPNLNLPITLNALELGNTGDGLRLEAMLLADLPSIFDGHEATATLVLDEADGISATIEAGTFMDTWDPSQSVTPLYEYIHYQDLGGGADDHFAVNLYGIRMEIGQNPALHFSAGITSTLLEAESGSPHSLFLAASYDAGAWDAAVSYDFPAGGLDLGLARFLPEEHEAMTLDISGDRFVAAFSGLVSFEDLLDDDFEVHVEELQLGVEGIQGSPSLVFGLGQATAQLPEQEFDLMEGTLAGEFSSSALSISGRVLTLTSGNGSVTFLEQDLSYQDFMVSTAGEFSIDNIGTDGFGLFEEYVVLDGLGVAFASDQGLSISSNFTVSLPDPVSNTASASIIFKRTQDGQINIESEGPDFGFEDESYPIGDLAEFHLHDAEVNINIQQPMMSRLVANGGIFYDGDEVISFGKKGNMGNNAGISFRPSRSPDPLQYNITGNIDFSIEYSFFEIHLEAEAGASNAQSDAFYVILGGSAGLALDAISGTVNYEGFTITPQGVEDIGNFDLSSGVSFSVMGFANLELGQFFYGDYRNTPSGSMSLTMETSASADADDGDVSQAAASQTVTEEVTQFLCFGSYPGIQTEEGDGCGSNNDALQLSLGGEGSSGGFDIGIEGLLFYETTDGAKLFYMEGINMAVHDMFSINGTIQYESDDDGFMLRLAATGEFEMPGEQGVSGMVAGKFENRDGLSFGLFAAFEMSGPDIPIVPPIVNLAGLGGGFFYNPNPDDIYFVHAALDDFGYTLYKPDKATQPDHDLKFAAMLYAKLNIGGAGGLSIVTGQTYLEVTNQAIYFDAAGAVLGLDGDGTPAGLDLSANMYLAVQFGQAGSGFDEFLIQGGFRLSISIPVYMDGVGTLDFFAGRLDGDPVVWGVQGGLEIDILNLLDGNITFLASDIGFYFEGGLGIDFTVFVFSFESKLEASVWYVRDPVAMGSTAAQQYPAGGYATARVEFCALGDKGCMGANATGAFIKRNQGFMVLAGASVWKFAGHVKVRSNGNVSAHLGNVENDPAIVAAKSLKGDFESYMDDLMASLEAAEQAVQESLRDITYDYEPPGDELIANAGFNLMGGSTWYRNQWAGHIRDNERNSSGFFPPALEAILSWVEGNNRTAQIRNGTFKVTTKQNITDLTNSISDASGSVMTKLDMLILEAIDIEEEIQQLYADFLDEMKESPVEGWSQVSPGNYQSESPSFQINMEQAEKQAQQAESLEQALNDLGLAMVEPLQQVEALLEDVDSAMFEQDESLAVDIADIYYHPDPSVLGFARMYQSAIQLINGYKINKANSLWVQADWAMNLREWFDQNQGNRNMAIAQITERLTLMDPDSDDFYDERVVTGNRLQMIYQLDNKDTYFRPVNSWGEVNQNARNYFLSTSDPDPQDVADRNFDFWDKMFDFGIDEYVESLEDGLEEVFESYEDLHNPMANAHRNLTVAIEDFYDLQASSYFIFYAMMDNFLNTFEGAEEELDAGLEQHITYYTGLKQTVSEMLQPPDFQAITVTPNRPQNNFFNETHISWSATHPQGVIESAIQIETGGSASGDLSVYHGLDAYRSTGLKPSTEIYLTRTTGWDITPDNIRSASHNTVDLDIGVRVRGPAGTTATRRAGFQVDVGPEGSGVPPGHNALPDQYEDTPPQAPVAEMDQVLGYNIAEVAGNIGLPGTQNEEDDETGPLLRYWTNNSQVIPIQARASDDITGISRFEYAVGSSQGAQDIVEWSMLPGVITQTADGYHRIRGDSRVIGLVEGEDYFVSLRAVNGAGQTSPATSVALPVRYEAAPPENIQQDSFSTPVTSVLGYSPYFVAVWGGPQVFDPVYEAPSDFYEGYDAGSVNREQRANPKIAVTWTESSDDESGL
ncbi:MAG: hypothetical protein R6U28_12520, partial [Cyclonatronaceae bacterium]